MSKKNSVQEKHRQQRKKRVAEEKAIQKQKNIKKGFIIAISAAVAITIAVTAIVIGVAKYKETNAYKTGIAPITCRDNSVDLAMLSYYYYDGVYGLLDLYGEELEKNGIRPDPSKPLDDQYNGESSWHDYFVDSALGQITQNLILAQAAKDEGITITDSEESALSAKADRIDISRYGKGVTKNDILKCLRLDYIAIKYEFTKRSADEMATDELIARSDLIFTMTSSHKNALLRHFPQAQNKISTLLPNCDVPDPFGGTFDIYMATFNSFRKQIEVLAKTIAAKEK